LSAEKKNIVEIMSPVGSYESLMAAVQGGADAIYFGVGALNMRARSSVNFSLEDLQKISQICQKENIRTYLTVNTIVYDNEIEEIHQIIDTALDCKINAVIASDWAVINYCSQKSMEVHISTQCNVTNFEAVKFYAQYADVMVLARELSLEQTAEIIQQIHSQNITGPSGQLIRIELFAHGALCMAVSGKCYLSLEHFNFSANRGACLQPCRRTYNVKSSDNEVDVLIDNEYIMSPKDLCTIGFLDKILSAGVKVLKIEGRGRSPEYVKIATSCYKEAVNAYFSGDYNQKNIDKWTSELENIYNRGFWDGYYLGQKLGEWTQSYGSQAKKTKIYVGKVTNFFSKLSIAEIKMETQNLQIGDEYFIIGSTTGVYDDIVDEIHLDCHPVCEVKKGDLFSIKTKEKVRKNDKVYKIIINT
jgi:putative protease